MVLQPSHQRMAVLPSLSQSKVLECAGRISRRTPNMHQCFHQQSARHYDKKTRISPSRNSLRFENGKIRNDFARCDGGISRCSPCFLADNKSAILCISARMRNLRRSGMAAGYAMRGAGKISFGCPCRHSGGRRCEMSDKRTYSEEGPQCPHCGRQFTADDGAYYQNEYTEDDCDECGKKFSVEVCQTTSWSCDVIETPSAVPRPERGADK